MLNTGLILGPVFPSIETLVHKHVVSLARYLSSTPGRSDNSVLMLDAAKKQLLVRF